MKSVRIGVNGCGWIGRGTHIPAFIENSKSRLLGQTRFSCSSVSAETSVQGSSVERHSTGPVETRSL